MHCTGVIRQRRHGGGVAIYVRANLLLIVWFKPADDQNYKLLWVSVADVRVGAFSHPPRVTYTTDSLTNYIEYCIDELSQEFPAAPIVLAGDFKHIVDCDVEDSTGLQQLFTSPNVGQTLDRIFVSSQMYIVFRIVSSVIKSDHKAIIAYASQPMCVNKSKSENVSYCVAETTHTVPGVYLNA